MSFSFSRRDFPNDFIFGVATAAYQIEGSKFGNCGSSHWDTWSETPGNVHNSDNGSIACDHYNRFYDDLDIIVASVFFFTGTSPKSNISVKYFVEPSNQHNFFINSSLFSFKFFK